MGLLWTKEQLRAFIKENKLVTAQDAQNALKDPVRRSAAKNALPRYHGRGTQMDRTRTELGTDPSPTSVFYPDRIGQHLP